MRRSIFGAIFAVGMLLAAAIEAFAADAGRLETRTNDRTAVETFDYDALGRPTTLIDPDRPARQRLDHHV